MNTLRYSDLSAGKQFFRVLTMILYLGLFISAVTFAKGSTSSGSQMGGRLNRYGYVQVDSLELKEHIATKDFVLVNVHIPYGGEIPGTDANIPYSRIDEITTRFPEKDKTIVLYCRSGSMSSSASKELAALGYTQIIELKGGYNAWGRAGGELIVK
jgi:rhodanese-related sulfurtransferase